MPIRTRRSLTQSSADARVLVAVFVGGAIGTSTRVLLALRLPHDPGTWPWSTFAANVVGAFILGLFVAHASGRNLPESRHPLIAAGFCGGLTTFSSMQVEVLQMIDTDRLGLAVGYAAASVIVGLLVVAVATRLVRPLQVSS